MKTLPVDVSMEAVTTALRARWGFTAVTFTHLPLGFGSHHWVAEGNKGERWFITLDDLRAQHTGPTEEESFGNLSTAFSAAALLRDTANLSFVVAPLETVDHKVNHRLDERYSMAVFPFLDVEPTRHGEFRNPCDRDEALRCVGMIHNATSVIPVDALRRDTLEIPGRAGLLEAMRSTADAWNTGFYGERARRLLRESTDAVLRKLRDFDKRVSLTTRDTTDWVVTHGEPHAGNVIRTHAGDLVMVDWDTVAYAPRERDLWMLVNESSPDWSAYRQVTGITNVSDTAMDAYRLHWDLSEIAIFVSWFRNPHEKTEDMEVAWDALQGYIAGEPASGAP